MTATVPFRPRRADNRLEHGRLVKVWTGPPSVRVFSVMPSASKTEVVTYYPSYCRGHVAYTSLPDDRSLIRFVWTEEAAKACGRCATCTAHRFGFPGDVRCLHEVPREPSDLLSRNGSHVQHGHLVYDHEVPALFERCGLPV
jgi:hypothetical protein